jgi:hypothetical protein
VARKSEAGDVVDELLAIPPKQFTEARNAAARELAAGGDRAAAAEIKALPRPTLALWSLNRVAHEHPDLVATFIEAAEKLRKAHESGGDIRAATPPEREAEARVAAAAAKIAAGEGAATETVLRGIRGPLGAVAADPHVAATLRAGRLIREPEAPSIDLLLGSLPQAPAGATAKAPSKSDRNAKRRALQEEIATAKSAAADARDAAREAADAARAAEREWQRARKLADTAQGRSDAEGERVHELQARLKEL